MRGFGFDMFEYNVTMLWYPYMEEGCLVVDFPYLKYEWLMLDIMMILDDSLSSIIGYK